MLVVCAVLIVIVGLAIATLRTLRGPLWFPVRALAAAYTDFFRGMPLIILLYLVGFGLPGLRLQGMPDDPVVLGSLALVLTYSAYVAEVFRAGIESVHPSQRAAARSLGLSYGQTMRRGGAAAGGTPGAAAAAQRLRGAAEGRRADLGPGRPIDAVRQAQIARRRRRSTTRRTWWPGCCSCCWRSRPIRLADWVSLRAARRQQASGAL